MKIIIKIYLFFLGGEDIVESKYILMLLKDKHVITHTGHLNKLSSFDHES